MKKYILISLVCFTVQINGTIPQAVSEINLIHSDFILNDEERAIPINQVAIAMNLPVFNGYQTYEVPERFQHEISQNLIDDILLNKNKLHKKIGLINDVAFRKALFLFREKIKTDLIINDIQEVPIIAETVFTRGELEAWRNLNEQERHYTDATMQELHRTRRNEIIRGIIDRLEIKFEDFRDQYFEQIQQPWLRFLVMQYFQDLENYNFAFQQHALELFSSIGLYN